MEIENILEVEGVNAKGYGIIAQSVMFDRDLSVQSKAIYAYFVSYTGSGRTVFPKRETILTDLKMSKNAYYKHLKPLLDNGYIRISKAKGFKNKNVYTICNNPAKVKCFAAGLSSEQESQLSLDGINANGFGFIPKLIMQDKRLSIKSKGLIAFFYSLVQAGCRAFPHRSTICVFLGLSKDTYYKALNELITYNYITVKQRHTKKGHFSVNDYILNSNPSKTPCPKNCDNTENGSKAENLPCPENKDITNELIKTDFSPCPEKEDITENNRVRKNETLPCRENCDNNNSTSINSISNISPSNQEVSYIEYTNDTDKIRSEINALSCYDDISDKAYRQAVDTLVEMLSTPNFAIYRKQTVRTVDLFRYVNNCIEDDLDGKSLRDLFYQVSYNFELLQTKINIRKPRQYLKAFLFDEIYNYQ